MPFHFQCARYTVAQTVATVTWPVAFANPYPAQSLFPLPGAGSEYGQFYRALELNPLALPPAATETIEYGITF